MVIPAGAGGLPRASLARATHVMVVDRQRLGDRIGRVDDALLDQVLDAIVWVIGR